MLLQLFAKKKKKQKNSERQFFRKLEKPNFGSILVPLAMNSLKQDPYSKKKKII